MKKNFKLTRDTKYENKKAYGFVNNTIEKVCLSIGVIMLAATLSLTSCDIEAEVDLPETYETGEQEVDNYVEIDVIHEVDYFETLSEIAEKYNTTITEIVKLNNITNPNIIKIGQKLKIKQRIEVNVVIVKEGDTLTSIAQRNNTTVEEIQLINNIENPNLIRTNQRLQVPVKEITPEKEFVDTNELINSFDKELDKNGYVQGIDISKWQDGINLDEVLKQNKQIKYVIVRSNYFIDNYDLQDEKILEYAKIAKNHNVAFGIYYWPDFTNIEETKYELSKVMDVVKELEENNCYLTMPICLDIETKEDDGGTVTDRIKAKDKETLKCFEYVKNFWQENGYSLVVYTGDNTKEYGVHDLTNDHNLKLWVARYPYGASEYEQVPIYRNVKEVEMKLDCKYKPIGKQYAIGKVDGFDDAIDLDVWYENTPKNIIESGLNNTDEMPKTQIR